MPSGLSPELEKQFPYLTLVKTSRTVICFCKYLPLLADCPHFRPHYIQETSGDGYYWQVTALSSDFVPRCHDCHIPKEPKIFTVRP